MRVAVAVWRLVRSVVHLLHGMAIVALRFGSLDAVERQAPHRLVVGRAAARARRASALHGQLSGPVRRCW